MSGDAAVAEPPAPPPESKPEPDWQLARGPMSCELRDGIATLTMAHEPLNVFDDLSMKDLLHVVTELGRQPACRALVLRSSLKAFSAGVSVEAHRGAAARPTLKLFHRMVTTVEKFEAPTVAVVEGAAFGGGFELALACDLRVVAAEAKLGAPEISLGVYPPYAIVRLPELVGRGRAARLVLTGDPVRGQEAYELGVAEYVFPRAELGDGLATLLASLKAKSSSSLHITKDALRVGHTAGKSRLDAVESLYLDRLMATHDADEGLVAFLEKRDPEWKHR